MVSFKAIMVISDLHTQLSIYFYFQMKCKSLDCFNVENFNCYFVFSIFISKGVKIVELFNSFQLDYITSHQHARLDLTFLHPDDSGNDHCIYSTSFVE